MRHLLRMRRSRTALQTASLVVWRPPIPGAPRSGEPGTHKHECLDAIAQPGPKSVYGPGLVAARPILEWVDRRAPNFQFRCCAPHLPSPHPKNNPGRQIPCDTSAVSRMEVVRAPTPKQRGRCGLDAMRIDPGDRESQQLRGEKRNSKVPDGALGFVCASTGNGDQALKRVIGLPALRRSVLAEGAAPILV